jgi:hypothetical protein
MITRRQFSKFGLGLAALSQTARQIFANGGNAMQNYRYYLLEYKADLCLMPVGILIAEACNATIPRGEALLPSILNKLRCFSFRLKLW